MPELRTKTDKAIEATSYALEVALNERTRVQDKINKLREKLDFLFEQNAREHEQNPRRWKGIK